MYNKPLSYSGKKVYQQCPRRWHSRYVLGVKEPQGKSAERGEKLHKEIELFFTADRQLTSAELMPWRRALEALKPHAPKAEVEWTVDADWVPTDWGADNAFYRGKADLYVQEGTTCTIYDWKTGKVYADHPLQGETYVALAPQGCDTYRMEFWYIDQPLRVETYTYSAKHREHFIEMLKQDVHTIRNADVFPPTPSNDACRFCPLSWRNGGSCDAAK